MDTKDIKVEAANPAENVGNPAEETRLEGDTKADVQPSQLDNLRNMMSSRYPEQQFGTDDDIYAKIADDYATHDKDIKHYQEQEGKIKELFTRDARSAQFMDDWMNGNDPVISLVKRYGEDLREILDDPEKQEEIAKANKEFVDRLAKEKDLEEEYKKNIDESLDTMDELAEEKGLTEEQLDGAIESLKTMANDILMGKFTKEALMSAIHAMNYDADMESAAHEAEVRGKNQKIDAQLRKPSKGDGMPSLGSRGTGSSAAPKPSIAGALGREKKSIWDAGGGIKRTSK